MELNHLMKLMLLCITIPIFTVCNNNIEFTRIIEGRNWGLQPDDSCWYTERILIKNAPQNNLEQSKIMIAYFDSIGFSVHELSKMPEIKYYHMFFCKSTRATRRFFIEINDVNERKYLTYDANKTYLGDIFVGHCKNDSNKWRISITRNLGTEPDCEYIGAKTRSEFLQNECDSNWYEANKNNELVRYYMELRDKKQ